VTTHAILAPIIRGRGTLHPVAFLAAVLLHAAAAVGLVHWDRERPATDEAIVISLEPDPALSDEPVAEKAMPAEQEPQRQAEVAPSPPSPEDPATAEEVPPPPDPPMQVLTTTQPAPETSEPIEMAPQELPRPPVPPSPRRMAVPRQRAVPTPTAVTSEAEPRATAPPAAASASAAPAIHPDWQSKLSAWLMTHRSYPDAARRHGDEGTVTVRFAVTPDGAVNSVTLAKGSGHATLDEAAMAMLRGAHVPPFPSSMPQLSVTIAVPIRYSLEH
jgi:periplasmic protein TonB